MSGTESGTGTTPTRRGRCNLGGKGINQSIAIARAGQVPVHVGAVGIDDHWMIDQVKNFGIDTAHIAQSAHPTGHAVIYVDDLVSKHTRQLMIIQGQLVQAPGDKYAAARR